MLKGYTMLIGVLLVALSIMSWGCAGDLPQAQRKDTLDMNWSKSVKSAALSQTLNPEAGTEPTPVVGLDGQAAAGNMGKYRTLLKQTPKVKQTVGIGKTVGGRSSR
jgi:hypothetical protein